MLQNLDAELRNELEKLLASDGRGETLVHDAITQGEWLLDDASAQRFGPYRATGILGQGGMGAIYRAVRDDQAFDKQVAIKVLHVGMETAAGVERFRTERQILAGLEHPYIARLIDGGETATGLPFIVLEYVEGEPINRYCDLLRFSPRQRMDLFLKVCEAAEYAHRNLIVHRDLKPANILVTADGAPKLLDFGIAKLLEIDAQQTMTLFQALTPNYASPEQVRGQAITTASDVYSLGVVLYELLAGKRPYEISTLTPSEIDRVVCEEEPAAPNVSPDIDNILLMAMRKDPARRYQSVEQFAHDIGRYIENRPVLARKDTRRYRAGKFVRRNAIALSAAAAVIVALVGGAAVALHQARIAGQRFEEVRSLAHSFVFDYHDELAKIDGTTALREKMVRTALAYLDSLAKNSAGDIGLRKELAAAYQKVGDAQGFPARPSLGHTDQALASYRKAAEIHESVAAGDTHYRRELAGFYTSYATLLAHTGDNAGAAQMGQSALASLETVARERPEDEAVRIRLARAWCLLGDIDENLDHNAEAYSKNRKCDAIARAALGRWKDRDALEMAQTARARVGTTARETGRLKEALSAFDEDEELLNRLIALEPANPSFLRSRAILGQFRSAAYYDDVMPSLNDPVRCLEYSRQYLGFARQMAASDAKNASAQFSLATAWFRLSYALQHSDPPAAVSAARESVRMFDEQIAAGRQSYLIQSRRARALRRLSEALLIAGQADEARTAAWAAVAEQRKVAGRNARDLQEADLLAMMLVDLAEAADARHMYKEGGESLVEAERIASAVYAENPGELTSLIPLVRVNKDLGMHWRTTGDGARAQNSFDQIQRLWREFPDRNEFVRRQAALAARNNF